MTTLLGCIADDLTGATDIAGLLARAGVSVSLRLGVPAESPSDTAAFEVIALKCRTAPKDEAIEDAKAALQWLMDAGAQRFFWKYCSTFNSTPQGNIGPVAEALLDMLDEEQTIYCPAFPENGRTVFMGHLFVGDQLLSDSPMKDHPLTPMRDSNLVRLLEPQVTRPVGLINRHTVAAGTVALKDRLEDLKASGVAHVLVDAVANVDLFGIARACRSMKLMTGGSAIAMPLPRLYVDEGLLPEHEEWASLPYLNSKGVVLSGSCSAMTRVQIAAYAAEAPSYQLDPLVVATKGLADAQSWLAEQDLSHAPILYATTEPERVKAAQDALGITEAGEVVEQALATLAVDALKLGASRFVVAGGETSGAVAKALGVTRLDVSEEIAPGVPWCFCTDAGMEIALALKSGNFGSESFFQDAFARLKGLERA